MHGTTFCVLKVTSQMATPGAESAVYDCLACSCYLHEWPWLGPPLAAMRYVICFRFTDDVTFVHNVV